MNEYASSALLIRLAPDSGLNFIGVKDICSPLRYRFERSPIILLQFGTFETCRRSLRMSAYRRRAELLIGATGMLLDVTRAGFIGDGSVFPRVPTGNTMAPCVVVGERAARFIKGRHAI